MLTKKDLEHLAELARLDLDDKEAPMPVDNGNGVPTGSVGKEKLIKDLGNILNYFGELQKLDTENVLPMTGGTELKNSVREDIVGGTNDTGKGPEQFPDKQDGYLRVPPVF